ncbi:MAG: NINE protein [Bacteroidetes bacterium]|jgi:TM2 domain-containing membrane protein YozV|nr:NINE protein [Bacteroidota bacterium]
MSKVLRYLPEIEDDEQLYVAQLITDMSDEQAKQFAYVYRERRREPIHILLLALVGFLGVAGAHRFYIDEIGMGVLYLLTGGLCVIGTIIDLFNYKDLAFRYNRRQADEVAALVGDAFPDDDEEGTPPSFDA